ncbi:MAG: Methyltransferase domain [Marinobacter excellens HL-55]|uniref:Methyltransferase domain n=1 Tax=Marinobacter excellens HL-55 TaxID=1305731 RepID=A0A0N8KK43_9GAMM|nr:MAG: Methyltransferase domain [Marinobacter excellens HL-55]
MVAGDHEQPRCPVCETGILQPFRTVAGIRYLRCGQCQATVMAPECRLTPDEERAVYALHNNEPEDGGYRRFLSKLSEPLLTKLTSGAQGLDFGCGPGPALAGMMQEAGYEMALYDPFFHPTMSALERQYDFITCTEVVEHLYRPAEVFRQLDSLLKPGGWLGIMTCFQTDDDRFDHWHYRRDPTHVVFYRELTLAWLADHYGWQFEVPCKDVVLFRKEG